MKMSKKTDDFLSKTFPSIFTKSGYRKCPRCGGSGHVMLPPYYAKIMPKPVSYPCETCGGSGHVFVVPDNTAIVRESDYK